MSTKIQTHTGDLLAGVSTGIIVHGCNAEGVMGAGFALFLKRRYPKAFEAYREAYEQCGLVLGTIVPYIENPGDMYRDPLVIANAITQQTTGTDRRQVDYPAVRSCFKHVAKLARVAIVKDVHFPLIGCGLAGGEWSVIEPIIEEELDGLNAHLWVLPSTP
jgi:O-acetyl-ADP-ribose deacetylase (regulator of RNase III)